MDWAIYRQLSQIAFHPKLHQFLQRSAGNVRPAEINSFGDWGDDLGFRLFFARTFENRSIDLPTIRMAVARYLVHDCPRLRSHLYLKTEGSLTESGTRPRFLVYCNWPYTR